MTHDRLRRSAVAGGAALAFMLALLALLPAPASPTGGVALADGPSWRLTDVRVIREESEGNHTYSMSDGSATHTMVSPGTGDRFVSTATWTAPKPSYQGGDTVELTLRVAIAEYVWNGDPDSGYIHQGLNFVGDDIHARIDMAGQWGGGVTAGAIYLRDENGQDMFSVKTDNGTQVVPSAGGAVSAVFPAGGSIGETKGIYIYSPGDFVSYTYTWIAEDEGPATAPSGDTPTLRPIRGTVYISRDNGATWKLLTKKTQINNSDMIRTEGDTRAELVYPDGSVFRVKSDSLITVRPNGIQLHVGSSWFDLRKQGRAFEVITPMTVCGVLGTEFSVEVDDDGTTGVKLFEGTVELQATTGGPTMVLEPGEMVSATLDGLGEAETFDIDAEMAELEASWGETSSEGMPRWLLGTIIVVGAFLVAAVLLILVLRASKRPDRARQAAIPMGQAVPEMPGKTSIPVMPAGPRQVSCRACGRPLGEDAAFCGSCGAAGPFIAPDWYYLKAGGRQGQQVGPFLWAQLVAEAQAGRLHPGDLLWNPSLPQWISAGQVGGLFR